MKATMTRLVAGRSMSALFFAVALTGAVLAFGLGMREVYDRPAIDFGHERVGRSGLVATVQVNVRNRSDETRCPEVRIAARDREGLDLAEEVAAPEEGEGRLEPGQSMTYMATFRSVTAKEYREELDEFAAYAFSSEPC